MSTDVATTSSRPNACALCRRHVPLTFHHLIPRKVHRRTYFRKNFSRETLARGIHVCRKCHNGIHKLFDEMQLAKELYSLDRLQASEALTRHVDWVARQKA
jgi:hypothetical protein